CVHALLAAGVARILVFDNSAGPGQSSASEFPNGPGAEVQVVHSEHNLGFAAGVNAGIERCLALWPQHWILLVNNDALVPAGLPARLAQALSSDASAAL